MIGWFGNTDYDWYRLLAEQPNIDEVNFWQPSATRPPAQLEVGTPFFFKLKKPHYSIGGYGFLLKFSVLPTDVAWETFGIKNGATSFEIMRDRISRYRTRPLRPDENPDIGCLLVQQPVFFKPADWIEQPRDWPKQAVQGKRYDLEVGEGRRVWEACLGRTPVVDAPLAVAVADRPRFGKPVLVPPRLGQGSFRIAVLDAYGRSCAVTGEHSLPVLEAAHIRPYKSGGEHETRNGLLLRSDLHRLFDRGFVTVTPDLKFQVSSKLRGRWNNGRTYYSYDGASVRVPANHKLAPDRELLHWHAREVFVA